MDFRKAIFEASFWGQDGKIVFLKSLTMETIVSGNGMGCVWEMGQAGCSPHAMDGPF